jgi:hypothetical protein
MTCRVVEQTADTLVLAIEHADHQSFSRAVDPRAMREARKRITGTWALIDATYGHDVARPRRCESIYTFRRKAL